MSVFENGKNTATGETSLTGLDKAILMAIEKAGESIVEKVAKTMEFSRMHAGRTEQEQDENDNTMRALAKLASATRKLDGTNFSTLGKEESFKPNTNIDEAIDDIGEV